MRAPVFSMLLVAGVALPARAAAPASNPGHFHCLTFQMPAGWKQVPLKPTAEAGSQALIVGPDVQAALRSQDYFTVRVRPAEGITLEEVREGVAAAFGGKPLLVSDAEFRRRVGVAVDARAKVEVPMVRAREIGGQRAFELIGDDEITSGGKTVRYAGRTVVVEAAGDFYIVTAGIPAGRMDLAQLADAFIGSLKLGGCGALPSATTTASAPEAAKKR